MKVLEVFGYVFEEKEEISPRYLGSQRGDRCMLKRAGVKEQRMLTVYSCEESGARSLKKYGEQVRSFRLSG